MSFVRSLVLIILLSVMPLQLTLSEEIDSSELIRIERLAGLCRLWGVVNYFHPFLAYKDINWDEALIKTIPRVNQAKTPEDYRRAVDYLLSFLKDPNTFVRDSSSRFIPANISDLNKYGALYRTDDSIAVITADKIIKYGCIAEIVTGIDDIRICAATARGVVIDARNLDRSAISEPLPVDLFHFYVQVMLKNHLNFPSTRSLAYMADATGVPGDFQPLAAEFVYRAGTESPGMFEGDTPPRIVFIMNEGSDTFQELAVALQESHQAAILYEGPFWRELGVRTFPVTLPDNLLVEVRMDEMIRSDGTSATHPDLVIPYTTDTTYLDSPPITMAMEIINGTRDIPPALADFLPTVTPYRGDSAGFSENLPTPEYRILAVSKYWNAVKYFYPFYNQTDCSKDDFLSEQIGAMEKVDSRMSYIAALAKMTARMNDSNADVRSSGDDRLFGEFQPNLEVKYVAGQTIVHRVNNKDTPELTPGDIVVAIDNENIDDRRFRLSQFLSASTPQAREAKTDEFLLRGAHASDAHLTVQKANGDIIEVTAKRSVKEATFSRDNRIRGILNRGYGYLNLDAPIFELSLNEILDAIHGTRALILDFRGISNFDLTLLRYLIAKDIIGSRTYLLGRRSPDCSVSSWTISDDRLSPPEDGKPYDGKIVVLIDGSTKQGAEKACLFLKEGADATLIGTPTNGMPGLVTMISLPGNVRVGYTTADVRYPDDSPICGVGIQPDILVEPTIEGIRQGRDEILEAAVEYLEHELKK